MAQTLTLTPHQYKMSRGRAVLTALRPYVRVHAEDGPPVFIQEGHFYAEGGQKISEDDLPDWLWGEIEKLSEPVKQEVGLSTKSDQNLIKSGGAKK